MPSLARVREIVRSDGLLQLARKSIAFAYASVWPWLPESEKHCLMNGVRVDRKRRVTDSLFPEWVISLTPAVVPGHETGYITALESALSAGDSVVLIGGGTGVSTVRTAEVVGSNGDVTVYEAGQKQVEQTRRAAYLNGVSDRVTVLHALVGDGYAVRSDSSSAAVVPVEELPRCDVVGIDADGAELQICGQLSPERAGDVVVEHHRVTDENGTEIVPFDPSGLKTRLTQRGYTIVEEWREDPKHDRSFPEHFIHARNSVS